MRDTAITAAKAGGAIIKGYFGQAVTFERKKDSSVVSQADKEAEDAIISVIKGRYPDHAINGEESGSSGSSAYTWHIDPLDGTTNFRYGIPMCAVSIGLEHEGMFILGVIYDPFRDELYVAERGKGATCNGKGIHVSHERTGIVVLDASFRGSPGPLKMRFLQACLDLGLKPQIIGSNVLQLCEVARGQIVASLSDTIHAWDYAAGTALVHEAGGVVTDQYGNIPDAHATCVLATATKELHATLLPIVTELYDGYTGRD